MVLKNKSFISSNEPYGRRQDDHFFILLSVLELKAIEEPELEKRLGKEYLECKKGTPMFVPWLRAKSKMTEVTKKYWSKN